MKKGLQNRRKTGRKAFRKKIYGIPAVLLFLALAACTAKEPGAAEQEKEEIMQDVAVESESIEGTVGETEPGNQTEDNDSPAGAGTLEGQIADQSFPVELDGWGNVTFAPFAPLEYPSDHPDYGTTMFGDVRFMLLSEDKAVYTFPGETPDDMLSGRTRFSQVLSTAFKDYNEDGRTDILLLLEYTDSGDKTVRRVRGYTQEEGEKEFRLDREVSEYLGNYTENMARVEEGIRDYRESYAISIGSDISAWEVERFAKKVRTMVLEGNYEGLASECAYPVMVDGVSYENKEALLAANLLQELPQSFIEAISQESCSQMYHNWQGIALGSGKIWISEVLNADLSSQGLKIITFNPGMTDGTAAGTAGGTADDGSTGNPGMSEEELMAFINERSASYTRSAYYDEIINYWENVREVRDISFHMEYLFDTDRKYLTKQELSDETPTVIHLAKNEIYARHGYIFQDKDLYQYFLCYTWYVPSVAPEDFSDEVFNEYERANLELLDSLDT